MSEPKLSTPVAILLAGALIGAGLLIGLRGRPAASASAPPAVTAGVDAPTDTRPPLPPVVMAPPSATKATVLAQAKEALEAHRPLLVEKCWKPSVAKRPEPKSIHYVFDMTFDAAGNQLMRGITESRVDARADVSACISSVLPPLKIPPPGMVTAVDVAFSIP